MADLHDNDPQTHKRTSINELLNPVAARPAQPQESQSVNNGKRLCTRASVIIDHIVPSFQLFFTYACALIQSSGCQLGSQWFQTARRGPMSLSPVSCFSAGLPRPPNVGNGAPRPTEARRRRLYNVYVGLGCKPWFFCPRRLPSAFHEFSRAIRA